MKVKALDTIRISSAGGRKEQGEEFEVTDHEGRELIERGLVAETEGKAEKAPKNKAAKPRGNKGAK